MRFFIVKRVYWEDARLRRSKIRFARESGNPLREEPLRVTVRGMNLCSLATDLYLPDFI